VISAHDEPVDFTLPRHQPGQHWERLLDTSLDDWSRRVVWDRATYRLPGQGVAVFRVTESTKTAGGAR